MCLDREGGEPAPQSLIGGDLAVLGQIAGDGAESRAGMVRRDVGEAGVEPRERVEPPEGFARRHQMQIGDVDEFHVLLLFSLLSRDPRNRPAASTIG